MKKSDASRLPQGDDGRDEPNRSSCGVSSQGGVCQAGQCWKIQVLLVSTVINDEGRHTLGYMSFRHPVYFFLMHSPLLSCDDHHRE